MTNPYTPTFPSNRDLTLSANPGAGYQVKLIDNLGASVVTWQTGMKTNFDDIRFCDDLDNQLSYWIESKTDSDNAVVWVKLVSASATIIILNWGNAEATSESSGANVFETFDDFTGTSLSAEFTASTGSSYTVEDSVLTVGNGADTIIVSADTYTTGCSVIAKIKTAHTPQYVASCDEEIYFCDSNGYGSRIRVVADYDNQYGTYTKSYANTDINTTALSGWAADTWSIVKIKFLSTEIKYFVGSTEVESVTDTNYIFANAKNIRIRGNGTGYYTYVDWVAVTKASAAEVYFTASSMPVTDFSADVVTGTHPLTVTFTDSSTNTPTSWAWNFGDGSISTDQNPSHDYIFPGTYKVSLTSANVSGSDIETKIDYIEVTPSASTIFIYLEKIEMDHKVGSTAKHTFKVAAGNGSGFKSTCTNPQILCSVNGLDETDETANWTISAFSATMNRFTLEVVDPGTWAAGDNINILILCDEGMASLYLNIVPNYSVFATATALEIVDTAVDGIATGITDIKGEGWATENLVSIKAGQLTAAQINAECDTAISDAVLATAAGLSELNDLSQADIVTALGTYGATTPANLTGVVEAIAGATGTESLDTIAADIAAISFTGGGGAEKVIPPNYYTLNATAKTITLTSPYNTLTVEQIKFIKDLDANYIIYDDRERDYDVLPISIADGVITYTVPALNTVAGNNIQISVNM